MQQRVFLVHHLLTLTIPFRDVSSKHDRCTKDNFLHQCSATSGKLLFGLVLVHFQFDIYYYNTKDQLWITRKQQTCTKNVDLDTIEST